MSNKPEYGVLTYISTADIYPHKDNPRKDLGDLTELAESIKVNGVLQNLTVVPIYGELTHDFVGKYTVVIGHRRLAAAKLAGVETVPCVVSDMTGMQQIRTMLTENMQRTDLTVYEQAQGFQMMLDLGDTVDQIAERAGFSKSTVRRRVKLLELDKSLFAKAATRGATLMDFAELDKIESLELKNHVLKSIGTANFRVELDKAVDAEKIKACMEKWLEVISGFATKIEKQGELNGESINMRYARNYNKWDLKREAEVPEDADTVRYFYTVSDREIDLYREQQAEVKSQEDLEREQRHREYGMRKKCLEDMSMRHFKLRFEFVKAFSREKKNLSAIAGFAANIMAHPYHDGYRRDITSHTVAAEILGIETVKENNYSDPHVDPEQFAAIVASNPERALLAIAYGMYDHGQLSYFRDQWNSKKGCSELAYVHSKALDAVYEFLGSLGYEMSDEELDMAEGRHEFLAPEIPDEDDEDFDEVDYGDEDFEDEDLEDEGVEQEDE